MIQDGSEKIDYATVGLKCGLEVHQQLDTKKLFCNCPSLLRNDEPDYVVERKLHSIAGETGDIDAAAAYQASLGKTYQYQAYRDSTCLVELDEEPPHLLQEEALRIALQISILPHATPLKVTQVMRKTVIDGSNTSGFQRTIFIAADGFVQTSRGRVGIVSVCLEEDAARIIEKSDEYVVYRLDRLGIPLIEIATAPDIQTPEQAREVALYIGEILRACAVKRGIGTIRQDVNVSITRGKRVELKGVQEPSLIVKAIDAEVIRQLKIIQEKKAMKSEVRNALPSGESEFLMPMPGAARMYPETDLPLLRISKSMIDDAKHSLPKMKSELKEDLKRYGLHEELLKLILNEHLVDNFKELVSIHRNPAFVAKMIALYPKELSVKKDVSSEVLREKLHQDIFVAILEAIASKKLKESHVKDVLERIVDGEDLKKALEFEEEDISSVEERILHFMRRKPGLSANAYMGLLMQEFRGKVDGKTLLQLIQKFMKK